MAEVRIVPGRTALINVDMWNRFVENSPVAAPRALQVLKRINLVVEMPGRRHSGDSCEACLATMSRMQGIPSEIPPIRQGMINRGSVAWPFSIAQSAKIVVSLEGPTVSRNRR
jgi:hypothetical protein